MVKKIIADLLIIFSGFILLTDNLIDYLKIEFENNFGFSSSSNLVYNIEQNLAVLIIVLTFSLKLKPRTYTFFFPIYISILELYWIFFEVKYSDSSYFNLYVLIASLFLLSFIYIVREDYKDNLLSKSKIDFLKAMLSLHEVSYKKLKK